jgi:transcriptional regulator
VKHRQAKHTNDRLQGTLDLVILKSLDSRGPMHGYAMAEHIGRISSSTLRIEEGSLYPALHRMTHAGWLRAAWRQSETGRRARYYAITPAGLRQLAEEEKNWIALTRAIALVLQHTEG